MISVSTCWRSDRIRDGARLVDAVVDVGADALELEYRMTSDMFAQAKGQLAVRHVPVSSVHNVFPVPDDDESGRGSGEVFQFASDDEDDRRRAIEHGIRSMEAAAEIGAKAVIFHLSKVDMPTGMDELRAFYDEGAIESAEARRFRSDFLAARKRLAPKAFDHVLWSLERLVPAAEEHGVTIAVENRYHPNEIPDFSEIGRILAEYEGAPVGYWHDIGHAEVQGRLGIYPHEELLAAYSGRMSGVHVHDVVGHEDHWAPGTGEVDFSRIVPYVPSEAIVVIEAHGKVSREELVASLGFVRGIGLD